MFEGRDRPRWMVTERCDESGMEITLFARCHDGTEAPIGTCWMQDEAAVDALRADAREQVTMRNDRVL